VAAALEEGLPVTVLPGPSAVETAVVASGFAAERYQFVGFLPRRAGELETLWRELTHWRHAFVAFESPARLGRSLASLAEVLPERPVAVCRELTKRFEEVVRGPAAEVAERLHDGVKGEITLVVGPSPPSRKADEEGAFAAVGELVAGGTSRSTAADVVSRLTGVPRNRLYRSSL
jgi:16S rRNA (cytidine1402-2'-O)-methyltransferase